MRISDWSSDVCSSDLRAVGIAVVIFVYVLLFEINGGGSDAVIGLEIDLAGEMRGRVARPSEPEAAVLPQRGGQCDGQPALVPGALGDRLLNAVGNYRSEEHTSELQSLMRISYAVFCLKNKNTHKQHHNAR